MTKPDVTLQPSKGVVTQAAAQVLAAYIASGRVKDDETEQWIKRAIREVATIARTVDASFRSDEEMPDDQQTVVEPPKTGRGLDGTA
jgi:hypothetical protein